VVDATKESKADAACVKMRQAFEKECIPSWVGSSLCQLRFGIIFVIFKYIETVILISFQLGGLLYKEASDR